jgi:AraC-like DNA-binding protein
MSSPQSLSIVPYQPHPALQDYIISYAYHELRTDALANLDLFPCGISTLVILLSEHTEIICATTKKKYRDRFYFIGQYSKFSPFLSNNSNAITITFKPYGAYALFGIPQHHCLDQNIDATALFPEIKSIVSAITDFCDQPKQCISIIENFLLKKLAGDNAFADKRIIYACNAIAQRGGNLSVKDLAHFTAMSSRSLELHFKEKVGLRPKLFSRILRFSDTIHYIRRTQSVDWQEVSFRFNYFDQAHFIREFKYFFGTTPSKIMADTHSVAFFVAEKIAESKQ